MPIPLAAIAIACGIAFVLAFRVYGRFVASRYALDDARVTPAVTKRDGVDFIPTRRAVLLAQHFASIAAAGPVVGPITAALAFGWAPSLAWIVLGSIFIGACHDFSSLVASVRHGARSIPEMVRENLGPRAYALSLAFIWLSLLYVIIAFTDVTARQFVAVEEWDGVAHPIGAGVATSSFLYLGLSVLMGFAMERFRVPLWICMAVFLPVLFGVIVLGQSIPLSLPFADPVVAWGIVILVYCGIASVLPMWVLLQPRGTLGGFFLYVTLAVGFLGLVFGGFRAEYPAFEGWVAPRIGPIFPFLFVTIACGACSGFHGLVCSGTTCKQVGRESHMPLIGYGAMLLEGVVAVMALATVMMWAKGSPQLAAPPSVIYARGIAHFTNAVLHVPVHWGLTFGMLAFATFVYDTLDVSTRLGRYLLEELLRLRGPAARWIATGLTLGLPMLYLVLAPGTVVVDGKPQPTWLIVWTIFGSSNQLLAALTLLFLAAWVSRGNVARAAAGRRGSRALFVKIPAVFMLVTTTCALALQLLQNIRLARSSAGLLSAAGINALLALALLAIALGFTYEWWRGMRAATFVNEPAHSPYGADHAS
jgi:carbon starvation protein